MIEALAVGGLSLVGGWLGAYLGAYLKKKAENLATHEDIDKLVDQMRAVTAATKEIESKVEGKVWDRQRRWELKRDVIFEANKAITDLVNSGAVLHAIVETDSGRTEGPRWDKRAEASTKLNEAARRFDEAVFRATLVCGRELVKRLSQFGILMRELANEINNGSTVAFMGAVEEMAVKREGIKIASRQELGFENEVA